MKNRYAFFLLACAFTSLNAQIVLNQSVVPAAGTSVTLKQLDADLASWGNAGQGAVYDWQDIVPLSTDSDIDMLAPAGLPGSGNFPSATQAYETVVRLKILYDVEGNQTWFAKTDANAFAILGAQQMEQDLSQQNPLLIATVQEQSLDNTPDDTLLFFPMQYNDSRSFPQLYLGLLAEANTSFPGNPINFIQLRRYFSRVVTADGEGSLQLPGGSFPVLRVKTVTTGVDTVFAKSTSGGTYAQFTGFPGATVYPVNYTETTYSYYNETEGLLAEISEKVSTENGNSTTTRFARARSEYVTSRNSDLLAGTQIYPNPTQGQVSLQLPNDVREAHVCIYDLSGSHCWLCQHAQNNQVLDVQHLPAGLYVVEVTAGNARYSGKLSVLPK